MEDAGCKRLFSRPRMVEDLLRGFAAREWSGDLDFASLTPLPASFVSGDLRQRHGDLVWSVRFRDDRRLYVVLLLEFQSAVDRSMAVRMLTYTGLLYEKLIADGVLREHGALPPVLPIVIYSGRRPWTAPVDVAKLIAPGGGRALRRHQPSERYFLLDERRAGGADLPSGNLVSSLVALRAAPDRERVQAVLDGLIELLRGQDDEELEAAFREWVNQVLVPRHFRGSASDPPPRLEEVRTMLTDNLAEWPAKLVEQGIEQGIEQGREEERALLCRQAARKFDAGAGRRLAAALAGVADADRLAEVGDLIIECGTATELFARLPGPSDATADDGRS